MFANQVCTTRSVAMAVGFGGLLSLMPPNALGQERTTVLISDTHMGVGRRADGEWDRYEDFRWPHAFRGFLRDISKRNKQRVDLVILGDMFELWQYPEGFSCQSKDADLGCSPSEFEQLLALVLSQHKEEIASLGSFVEGTENTVTIVPGNHDAAFLLPGVWAGFQSSLPSASRANIKLAAQGYWQSPDRVIYAEHGHQIGKDVNRFVNWPHIQGIGSELVIRSWGENFVQKLFNETERNYEIIDNIGPESAGIKYKYYTDGLKLTARDSARLIAFNIFETSRVQKSTLLGGVDTPSQTWDIDRAKGNGHKLVLSSLSRDDPFREMAVAATPEAGDLRMELDQLVAALDPVAIRQLCDQSASRGDTSQCLEPTQGSALQKIFDSKKAVLTDHLVDLIGAPGGEALRVFVYGHTHQYESPRPLDLGGAREVIVSNTGAFQRVVTSERLAKIAKGLPQSEVLRRISLKNLPACYSFIEVTGATPTLYWWVQEEGTNRGVRLDDEDPRCADVPSATGS